MCKEKLLNSSKNSFLGYLGAAILGLVLTAVFQLISSGTISYAIWLYIGYMFIINFLNILCDNGCCWACRFNEFWIALEELIKKKMESL